MTARRSGSPDYASHSIPPRGLSCVRPLLLGTAASQGNCSPRTSHQEQRWSLALSAAECTRGCKAPLCGCAPCRLSSLPWDDPFGGRSPGASPLRGGRLCGDFLRYQRALVKGRWPIQIATGTEGLYDGKMRCHRRPGSSGNRAEQRQPDRSRAALRCRAQFRCNPRPSDCFIDGSVQGMRCICSDRERPSRFWGCTALFAGSRAAANRGHDSRTVSLESRRILSLPHFTFPRSR